MELFKTRYEKAALLLSACLSAAGLAGIIYVVKMGVLPSNNLMGHTKEYERGWSLFFLVFLGAPCLLAFAGGLVHWILWFVKLRRKSCDRK